MITINDPRIAEFLSLWHENGRPFFERSYPNLKYDSATYQKTATNRRKYIALDDGTSGCFLLDKATGELWGIKAYGVIHRGKFMGHLDDLIVRFKATNAGIAAHLSKTT